MDLLKFLYIIFFTERVVPNGTCVNGNYLFKQPTCVDQQDLLFDNTCFRNKTYLLNNTHIMNNIYLHHE